MAVDVKGLGKAQKEFQKKYKRRLKMHSVIQLLCSLAISAAIIAGVGMYGFGLYNVTGDAMYKDVPEGSFVIGNKLAYVLNEPKRGDVIVTKSNDICRVIGMPGETIEFNGGFVYANGNILNEEAYLGDKDMEQTIYRKSCKVPADNYLVLRDGRSSKENFNDISLYVSKNNIESKVIYALSK